MDTLLLGITVVSFAVALVMSVAAWRLMRDENRRTAARIAALSAATSDEVAIADAPLTSPVVAKPLEKIARTPWRPAPFDSTSSWVADTDDVRLRADGATTVPSSFLGSSSVERTSGNRQRGLAIATIAFFIVVAGSLLSTMVGGDSAPSAAAAVSAAAPLELVSLSHARQNGKLAVSGLVRNPVSGRQVEKLSAVVFLFDRAGTFVTSSKAQVDYLKLGAGEESPFVVSIDAPESVTRYRVSFRTDDGVVAHIDRRGESPSPTGGEQPADITAK